MRLLRYSLLRLVILAAVLGALYLAGLRSWLLGLVAVAVAGLIAYLALPGARRSAAQSLADRDPARRPGASRTSGSGARDAADEDAEIETTRPA